MYLPKIAERSTRSRQFRPPSWRDGSHFRKAKPSGLGLKPPIAADYEMTRSFAFAFRAGWVQLHGSLTPIVIAMGLFIAIFSLRAFDLFVLRVDSWPDPTIVSRTLCLLLLFWYLRSLWLPRRQGRITRSQRRICSEHRWAQPIGDLCIAVCDRIPRTTRRGRDAAHRSRRHQSTNRSSHRHDVSVRVLRRTDTQRIWRGVHLSGNRPASVHAERIVVFVLGRPISRRRRYSQSRTSCGH